MLVIGLTGSIATGKSTVSRILSSPPHSLPVIDADLLARQVVEPGTPAYAAIVAHFGPTTPDLLLARPDGDNGDAAPHASPRPLNRAALARRVFGDSHERRAARTILNGIVHPPVRRAIARAVAAAWLRGCWAVVLDVPLLFEAGLDVGCGVVVVVAVRDPAVQMRRLRERDTGLSLREAEERVGSQGDVRVKAERAGRRGEGWGAVVWNDGGKGELAEEVARVVEACRRGSPAWWGRLLWACPPLALVSALWCYIRGMRAKRAWEKEMGIEWFRAKQKL